MKIINFFIGIISLIIIFIVLEMYGPLYVFHTEKGALNFVENEIVSQITHDNGHSITTNISIWDQKIPRVKVLISSYNKIQIPSEFKGKFEIINQEHYKEPYTVDNIVYYELRFEFPLIKKGSNNWAIINK